MAKHQTTTGALQPTGVGAVFTSTGGGDSSHSLREKKKKVAKKK